ncbi:MAG: hypothetical protein LBH25_05995 [Fibromonadaceae bacterium]|jgi:hypothetical protein|nr:hypothetical protein [Fibromonadaceae bacterium]
MKEKVTGIFEIVFSPTFIIVVLAVLFLIEKCQTINRIDSLMRNGKETKAVIYRLGSAKHGWRMYYSYTIDGIEYKYCESWNPKTDNLSVGDTIKVKYDKTNVGSVMYIPNSEPVDYEYIRQKLGFPVDTDNL